jgi:spermidine synthase
VRFLAGGAGGSRPLALGTAAFTGGAVLLSVEIAASRVLAPYFGNSLFVWGALIGVVLTGLSIGYWAGGALADRLPNPLLMVAVLGLGACSVLAIPFVDEAVLEAIVAWDPGPRLDPLLASVALFGPASVILAAVTPIAVRLLARSLTTLGRTAGRLFAISTAGSIAGTFATAFFLVPELGIDELLAFDAAALFVAAALFAASERRLVAFAAATAAFVGATLGGLALAPEQGGTLTAAQARNWSPVYRIRGQDEREAVDLGGDVKVVYRKESQYHRIAVTDDEDSRYLRFDSSFQSGMFLADPYRTRFEYVDYLHLGLAYRPGARRMLFIGLGGGSAPKRMWRDFPNLQIQVAELDPEVVKVARRYFGLPDDPRLRVAAEDGRRYLARHDDERWDVIAIDAFYSDSIPFHLTTREFLELAHERLAPGGIIVTNIIGALEGDGSRLFRSLYRTYGSVFPTVLVHPVTERGDDEESIRNIIVVATDQSPPTRTFLAARWRDLRERNPRIADLAKAIRNRRTGTFPTADVPILTDDYAPTDALLLAF